MKLSLTLAALLLAGAAQAQSFPTRPVTLVVPFPPGGGTDTGARIVAQKLGAKWGQTEAILADHQRTQDQDRVMRARAFVEPIARPQRRTPQTGIKLD